MEQFQGHKLQLVSWLLMFHILFCSLARSWYFLSFRFNLLFICVPQEFQNPQADNFFSYYCLILCLVYLDTNVSSCHAVSTDIPDPFSPPSLSSIASGRSSGLHPVSAQSCCRGSCWSSCFARPCKGVHCSTSLMSSSLLLQHVWFVLFW